MLKLLCVTLVTAALWACAAAPQSAPAAPTAKAVAPIDATATLEAAESIYADLNDAASVVGAIDSGLFSEYRGKDRSAWERQRRLAHEQLATLLAGLSAERLAEPEARVLAILRRKIESFADEPAQGDQAGRCADARHEPLPFDALSAALVGCFTEIANSLRFEAGSIDRASALGLLHQIDEPQRRKALFLSFVPLWQAVNGGNEPDSPYRRLISLAAHDAPHERLAHRCGGAHGGGDERRARTVAGAHPRSVERGDARRERRALGLSLRRRRGRSRPRRQSAARIDAGDRPPLLPRSRCGPRRARRALRPRAAPGQILGGLLGFSHSRPAVRARSGNRPSPACWRAIATAASAR